jgi:hypothetical protein
LGQNEGVMIGPEQRERLESVERLRQGKTVYWKGGCGRQLRGIGVAG